MSRTRPHVVIIGSGFGGLFAAKELAETDVDITLISKTTHHLFQPLLYQVATGILSPGSIAPTTREVLKDQRNVRVVMSEVSEIDVQAHTVTAETLQVRTTFSYDYLVVAAGAGQSYFGNDHFAAYAPGMKTIDDALELRARIYDAFEMAEITEDPGERERLMTFVVVGAGPTGVEMAGQIRDLSSRTLAGNFRRIDPTQARVILVDGIDAVLGSFGPTLSRKAKAELERIGVEVILEAFVTEMDSSSVTLKHKDGRLERIGTVCKVWAAGVQASSLGASLGSQTGAEVDRAGRIAVEPDLTLPGHPEVFVVGDMATLDQLPWVAQFALQGGRHAARAIASDVAGDRSHAPFRYSDRGSMAVISKFGAIAKIGPLRLRGFTAWAAWLVVHLVNIVGFKHQFVTLANWAIAFLSNGRAERTTTQQQLVGRLAVGQLGSSFHPTISGIQLPLEKPWDPDPGSGDDEGDAGHS